MGQALGHVDNRVERRLSLEFIIEVDFFPKGENLKGSSITITKAIRRRYSNAFECGSEMATDDVGFEGTLTRNGVTTQIGLGIVKMIIGNEDELFPRAKVVVVDENQIKINDYTVTFK